VPLWRTPAKQIQHRDTSTETHALRESATQDITTELDFGFQFRLDASSSWSSRYEDE